MRVQLKFCSNILSEKVKALGEQETIISLDIALL